MPGADFGRAGVCQSRVAIHLAWALIIGFAIGATADRAMAQTAAENAGVQVAESEENGLVFEREVFFYNRSGRRDPFNPLTGDAGVFPRFENITLRGVIYSDTPGESVAIVADRSGRVFRVRTGEVLGDSRVLSISRDRVSFAVTSFGLTRQEELVLRAPGAADAAATAAQPSAMASESELADEPPSEDGNTNAADAAGANQ